MFYIRFTKLSIMAKATNTVKRAYKGSDAAMLTVLAVIMNLAESYKTFLFSKRSNWNTTFFNSLNDEIKRVFKEVLGIEGLGDQTKASKELFDAMNEIMPKLRSFKNAVEIDFTDDNREQEILNSIGFRLWDKVEKGSQEALVELLATFVKNMTPALQSEITDAGTDASYITDITSYASIIKDKNIAQETKKKDKKTITSDGITQLNNIYNNVMKVAKHSANLFNEQKDYAKAEQFSYSKTLASLTTGEANKGTNGGDGTEVKK
jgi:hypothetical protein